ncbi:hypothetical protein SAMN05421819_2574 [Bryocella elongata]|uniref:Uncharacterized protein n=1 Tax=Bryocella elongata TaxID=863522 RepID=A0A1H5ZBL4_9BACT|nr:hypothetical protein [Bryocella elongata]SEG33889.1 hypothetical protein SAMN05421819_2574 [Bryocella elongata]
MLTLPRRFVYLTALFCKAFVLVVCAQVPETATLTPPRPPVWSGSNVEHVYGLMEAKAHAKGTLALNTDTLTFNSRSAHVVLPRTRILAMSTGHERVELFGTTGQILRMVIPDGGGIAAAAVMHHRVDMLTVQYVDAKGGEHAAVFYLPEIQAEAALAAFGTEPHSTHVVASKGCEGAVVEPGSVLVNTAGWADSSVPPAYRALVYEHVIDRLRKTKGVRYVYRSGESGPGGVCAQHVITLTLEGFRPGNQVKRSALGPIGLFVGTTQMTLSARITGEGGLNSTEEIKSSVRDQSESITVADKIAKRVAKRYAVAVMPPTGTAPRPEALPPATDSASRLYSEVE